MSGTPGWRRGAGRCDNDERPASSPRAGSRADRPSGRSLSGARRRRVGPLRRRAAPARRATLADQSFAARVDARTAADASAFPAPQARRRRGSAAARRRDPGRRSRRRERRSRSCSRAAPNAATTTAAPGSSRAASSKQADALAHAACDGLDDGEASRRLGLAQRRSRLLRRGDPRVLRGIGPAVRARPRPRAGRPRRQRRRAPRPVARRAPSRRARHGRALRHPRPAPGGRSAGLPQPLADAARPAEALRHALLHRRGAGGADGGARRRRAGRAAVDRARTRRSRAAPR